MNRPRCRKAPLGSGGHSTGEVLASLYPVASVAQHLHIAVCVRATEGEGPHVIHVHPVCGEVAQAPVAPGRPSFLHSPTKPSGTVPTIRPSSSPCPPRADVRTTLVRGVVVLAAAPMGRGLGAVDTAHVRPPGGVRHFVPAPGLEPGISADCVRISPRGAGTAHLCRWVSGLVG